MSETRTGPERRSLGLDTPARLRHGAWDRLRPNPDSFGQMTEGFARFMGTPQFLLWMTVFVVVWLGWNTLMPESLQFDPRALNFTLLTLMLSLQASYAAPLLLLAQNRQDDRDRVIAEQDRKRGEENLADTEYLIREIASLRMAVRDMATRDFVRSELRDLLQELLEDRQEKDGDAGSLSAPSTQRNASVAPTGAKKKKKKKVGAGESRDSKAAPTGLIPVVPASEPPLDPQDRGGLDTPAPRDAGDTAGTADNAGETAATADTDNTADPESTEAPREF